MRVISQNPVIINHKATGNNDQYIPFDGSKPMQVKAFQDWLDVKYPGWVAGGKLNKNVNKGYGKFGPSTKKAAVDHAAEFDAGAAKILGLFGGGSEDNTPTGTPQDNTKTDQPKDNAKTDQPKDNAKTDQPKTDQPKDENKSGGKKRGSKGAIVDNSGGGDIIGVEKPGMSMVMKIGIAA